MVWKVSSTRRLSGGASRVVRDERTRVPELAGPGTAGARARATPHTNRGRGSRDAVERFGVRDRHSAARRGAPGSCRTPRRGEERRWAGPSAIRPLPVAARDRAHTSSGPATSATDVHRRQRRPTTDGQSGVATCERGIERVARRGQAVADGRRTGPIRFAGIACACPQLVAGAPHRQLGAQRVDSRGGRGRRHPSREEAGLPRDLWRSTKGLPSRSPPNPRTEADRRRVDRQSRAGRLRQQRDRPREDSAVARPTTSVRK